jgi:hypothetical protein
MGVGERLGGTEVVGAGVKKASGAKDGLTVICWDCPILKARIPTAVRRARRMIAARSIAVFLEKEMERLLLFSIF